MGYLVPPVKTIISYDLLKSRGETLEEKKNTKARNQRQYAWQKENKDRINVLLDKGLNSEIKEIAKTHGKSASEWINEAIKEKMTGGISLDIPDMEIYAKSAKMTVEEYIKQSVIEKMQRQDENFTEEVTREKIDF